MAKINITAEINLVYDDETGELTVASTKQKTTRKKEKPTDFTGILREDNRLILSAEVCEQLQVVPDDRISIKYQYIKGKTVPVIAKDSNFGCSGGNKLTKSNTITCRGKANEELAKYGTNFQLERKGDSCIFMMIGNIPGQENVEDPAIKITEPEDNHSLESEDDLSFLNDESSDSEEIVFSLDL